MNEEQAKLKFENTKKIFQNEELLKTLCDFIVLKINKFNFNYFLKTIETWAYKGITTTKEAKEYLFKEDPYFIDEEWSHALPQKVDNLKKIFQNEELLKILCDFIVLKINKFNFNYFLKTIETWADKEKDIALDKFGLETESNENGDLCFDNLFASFIFSTNGGQNQNQPATENEQNPKLTNKKSKILCKQS